MRTIYRNGAVYTGELPLCRAFVVEDGRFICAGSDEDALAMKEPGDEVKDLKGRFVCAGFNDSHMHLLNYGNALGAADLSQHTQSLVRDEGIYEGIYPGAVPKARHLGKGKRMEPRLL